MAKWVTYNLSLHFPIFTKLHRLHLGSTQNAYIWPKLHKLIAPHIGGQISHLKLLQTLSDLHQTSLAALGLHPERTHMTKLTHAYSATYWWPNKSLLTSTFFVRSSPNFIGCTWARPGTHTYDQIYTNWCPNKSFIISPNIVRSSPNFIGCTWAPPRTHTYDQTYTCL